MVLRIFLALVALVLAVTGQGAQLFAADKHIRASDARATPPPLLTARAVRSRGSGEQPPKPQAAPPAADTSPPLPERAPAEIRKTTAKPREVFGPEMPTVWLPKEIKAAEEECSRLLAGLTFDYKLLPPIRNGVCGTAAPIGVKYISDLAKVELRPTPTMNCRVSEALARWLRDVVQPRAWELLDARIIRVVTMSSYDCRQRNGGSGRGFISQHAFANALDIAEFVTAKGEHIRVEEHWNTNDERAKFLREIHIGACQIFGTVLGPEANEAHRNHFHLDMTPRRHSSVCQ